MKVAYLRTSTRLEPRVFLAFVLKSLSAVVVLAVVAAEEDYVLHAVALLAVGIVRFLQTRSAPLPYLNTSPASKVPCISIRVGPLLPGEWGKGAGLPSMNYSAARPRMAQG